LHRLLARHIPQIWQHLPFPPARSRRIHLVLLPIMPQVTPLTQRHQISRRPWRRPAKLHQIIVVRIVVHMRHRQHNPDQPLPRSHSHLPRPRLRRVHRRKTAIRTTQP